jgi:N utilization substance protein A
MELVVPDEKLSLAIGRKGQNVRLASQLTGWKLDIISESKFQQMEDEALIALREIDGIDDGLAKSLYRLGFRALEEIHEAPLDELVGIDTIDTEEKAKVLKKGAEQAMERLRQDRIREALSTGAPLTDKDKLRFVRGIGQRTLALLEDAGYASPQQVAREDPDRLAIKTGLGNKKARQIHQGAQHFLANEAKEIEVARAELFGAQPGAEG